jgi:hypothetical protein
MNNRDSWLGAIKTWTRKVDTRSTAFFAGVVDKTHESIQLGSVLTGSPGQPVRYGTLRNSWIKSFPSVTLAEIVTNVIYAPDIEDGMRNGKPLTLRSQVGGFHSVALTRAGFDRIVAAQAAEMGEQR